MQMVQNFDEYQFIYKSTLFYVQNKIRYDNALMSKLINRNHTNDTDIEMPIDEEDDIYFSCPESVRRALNKDGNKTDEHARSVSLTNAHLNNRTSEILAKEMEGEYVLR